MIETEGGRDNGDDVAVSVAAAAVAATGAARGRGEVGSKPDVADSNTNSLDTTDKKDSNRMNVSSDRVKRH